MEKIYPNDTCPCGSGKKYKICCGKDIGVSNVDSVNSDKQLADFVIDTIKDDIVFLQVAMQKILGSEGYSYCSKHQKELDKEYKKDGLKRYVHMDELEVKSTAEDPGKKEEVLNASPYIGTVSDEVEVKNIDKLPLPPLGISTLMSLRKV